MKSTTDSPSPSAAPAAATLPKKSLTALVRGLLESYPNPDDPMPPGPWGPIIRKALARTQRVLAGGGAPAPLRALDLVALNPQPLPPGIVYAVSLAQVAIEQHEETHALAALLPEAVQGAVGRAAGDRLTRFIDDCGNAVLPPWKRDPVPGPPRGEGGLNGLELVAMGVCFETAAGSTLAGAAQGELARAGAALIEAGAARL